MHRIGLVLCMGVVVSLAPTGARVHAGPNPEEGSFIRCDETTGDCTHIIDAGGTGEADRPLAPASTLEPGFPVQTYHGGGSYHAGPAIHTLVANIDEEPTLEIIVTTTAEGPLYAFNSDGSLVAGWPASKVPGAGYPAAGELSTTISGYEVFSGHMWTPGHLIAYSGRQQPLPGWPKSSANYVSTPPSLADVNGDGRDEVFIGEEDWYLHAYRADGTALPGWPVFSQGGQETHTPATADLDDDGDIEVVTASGASTPGVYLYAFHHDGKPMTGFPLLFPNYGFPDTFPVVGDVDGDSSLEIVVLARETDYPWRAFIHVISAMGQTEGQWLAGGGGAPALADLDGDTFPEIIVQGGSSVYVWQGDGTALAGWPVSWSGTELWNSAPVVGDVDGDLLPDIVVTATIPGWRNEGEVRVYRGDGSLHPGFPIILSLGTAGVPAIADIDLDGRNEILVLGDFWDGHPGMYDKVWAFDLGGENHGRIEWGQFMGGPKHQGLYIPRPSFDDVPFGHWAFRYVEALHRHNFVAGCSLEPPRYCPEDGMTRAEAAVFVVRGTHDGDYLPPEPGEPYFADVPLGQWYTKWVDQLRRDGYTAGCGRNQEGAPLYCPTVAHTRAEAAVFFLHMLYGPSYFPPPPVEQAYDDVPIGDASPWYSKWIHAAYGEGLTAECEDYSGRRDVLYRPAERLTRAEAACMMVKAKGLLP